MANSRLFLIGLSLLILLSNALWAAEARDPLKELEIKSSYEAALIASPALPAETKPALTDSTLTKSALSEPAAILSADQMTHQFRMLEERQKLYEILILSLLALSSLFIVLRFITAKPSYTAADIVNVTGMIFIIFGTILLVIMVKTDEQLTASVGILGAIAGYLFGTMKTARSASEADSARKE